MEQGDVDSIVARCPVLEILNIQGCHMGLRLHLVSQSLRCVQVCSSVVESITVAKAPRLERLVLEGCRHTAAGLSTRVTIVDAPKLHTLGSLEPGNHVLEIRNTVAGVKASRSTILTSVKTLGLNVRSGVINEAKMLFTFLQCFPN
uniref:F-box/LRR-repeat protein 15/At3g58940/PEG3-like LRR domain-containing protein n=1 Tax=Triticum urartu TaxID=4572 RepID=A0A8R7TC81_TRIUA